VREKASLALLTGNYACGLSGALEKTFQLKGERKNAGKKQTEVSKRYCVSTFNVNWGDICRPEVDI
jgi:hypothetical protein